MECTLEDLKKMQQVQKDSLGSDPEDYMVGMYNGMEFFMSMIEGRDPYYIECKVKREDDLFKGIDTIKVTVPVNYTVDISEEEKKASEFEDTLNTNY